MGLNQIMIGIFATVLMAIALFSFSINLAVDNNSTIVLNDPSIIGKNNTFSTELQSKLSDVNKSRTSFESQGADATAQDGFGLVGIVGTVFGFVGYAISSFNLILALFAEIIGIPQIALNVLMAGILILLVLFAWRTIKSGGT